MSSPQPLAPSQRTRTAPGPLRDVVQRLLHFPGKTRAFAGRGAFKTAENEASSSSNASFVSQSPYQSNSASIFSRLVPEYYAQSRPSLRLLVIRSLFRLPRSSGLSAPPSIAAEPPPATMSSSIRRAAPLIVPAVERHTATVIFFHGLGDQGQGWVDVVEMMRQTKRRLGQVKFILPNAPTLPITMVSPSHHSGTAVGLRNRC
jgi:hypothetical protein